jgi:hypothetical protein
MSRVRLGWVASPWKRSRLRASASKRSHQSTGSDARLAWRTHIRNRLLGGSAAATAARMRATSGSGRRRRARRLQRLPMTATKARSLPTALPPEGSRSIPRLPLGGVEDAAPIAGNQQQKPRQREPDDTPVFRGHDGGGHAEGSAVAADAQGAHRQTRDLSGAQVGVPPGDADLGKGQSTGGLRDQGVVLGSACDQIAAVRREAAFRQHLLAIDPMVRSGELVFQARQLSRRSSHRDQLQRQRDGLPGDQGGLAVDVGLETQGFQGQPRVTALMAGRT